MKLTKLAMNLALPVFLAGGATIASAQDSVTLRMTDPYPTTNILSKLASQRFKDLVEERTGGSVTIQHFPAGQLTDAAGVLDAVKSGVVDMGIFVPSRVASTPLTTVVEVPGLYVDAVDGANALQSLLKNELAEEYAANKVKPLFGAVSAPYQLLMGDGFPTDTISDMSDLSGRKLQVTGATGELTVDALGATPVRIPSADRYVALERGTVDGAIYSTSGALGNGLERVLKATTVNGSFGSVSNVMVIRQDVWDRLSDDAKGAIQEVSDQLSTEVSAEFQKANEADTAKLEEAGMTLIELSPEVQDQFAGELTAVQDAWVAQMTDRGLPAEDTLAAFKGYLGNQ